MEDFSPEEMMGFEQAALKPYLKLDTFMRRETWSGAKTYLYLRTLDSTDKNWCSGLMVLQFRSGVCIVKAELWECYEGEGYGKEGAGLDERWDVGLAAFPNGFNETIIADLLGYVGQSDLVLNTHVKGNFLEFLGKFDALFKRYVKTHEESFKDPQEESAVAAVQAMIDSVNG